MPNSDRRDMSAKINRWMRIAATEEEKFRQSPPDPVYREASGDISKGDMVKLSSGKMVAAGPAVPNWGNTAAGDADMLLLLTQAQIEQLQRGEELIVTDEMLKDTDE